MDNTTAADLGTALVLYQAVSEILDNNAQERLEKVRFERFDKFKSRAQEIDATLLALEPAIEANCEQFCRIALDGIFALLEEHFPVDVEATSEDAAK